VDIDIILEPDLSPAQVAEIGVEAERLGIRAVWSSNYHMNYDAFLALAPLATATSKILIGPLAVSRLARSHGLAGQQRGPGMAAPASDHAGQ
jgi:alkanesulfonate monooxygenase SsuD/methylene tetrahydromethanopterin reductase-like flavin-dependent oxidoreductase (luciferase family)